MAQLDKTYPTLDCSICILGPKLVEVATHPNIELLTYAQVNRISGEPGNFHVKVTLKPRYVDMSRCVGAAVVPKYAR
jgi:heterodisulfide reductase subunit A